MAAAKKMAAKKVSAKKVPSKKAVSVSKGVPALHAHRMSSPPMKAC